MMGEEHFMPRNDMSDKCFNKPSGFYTMIHVATRKPFFLSKHFYIEMFVIRSLPTVSLRYVIIGILFMV